MKKRIFLFLCLTITSLSPIIAQMDSTQYLFEQFKDAAIFFKDNTQYKEKVNYNLIANRFFFIDRTDGSIKQVANAQNVRLIRIDNRSFILENEEGIEVLPTNPLIYVQYRANIREQAPKGAFGSASETTAVQTYGGTYDRGRRLELESKTIVAGSHYNIYWVEKKGKKKKFTNFKQFMKIYAEHKIELENFIKKNDVQFNDVEQIKSLCIFAGSL